MAVTSLYNQTGDAIGTVELNPTLFEAPLNTSLLYEAVVAQEANARQVLAHTKDRGDVRGGGKKPWKQKGTGRARHGSVRSPIWKGGGVTFGPTKFRNFARKLNKKARRAALASALSDAHRHERFLVVDSLVLPEVKTKILLTLLSKLPHPDERALVVVEETNTGIGVAASNTNDIRVIPVHCLNVKEVVKAKRIVASKEALERMDVLFGTHRSHL